VKSGSGFKVKVGDKECDVMGKGSNFKLIVTTKLPNPSYTPEIYARTSIVDFTVTVSGLEDQLLGRVIGYEKAEVETERVALMEDVANNKRKMQDLESNLLKRLTETEGSLVDDDSLIEVLEISKVTAKEVGEKLAIAAEAQIKIAAAREEFRPVAKRGSILYFLIVEMSQVNCMYQSALSQFIELFAKSLANSKKNPITAKRIKIIIDYLNFAVFSYTARGFYEEHKFLYALLLTLKIDLSGGKITNSQFQTFIKGGAALDLNTVEPKPFKWIQDLTWLNLVQLSKLNKFGSLLGQIAQNGKSWKDWYDSDEPEVTELPDGYDNGLDTFSKTLLIRSWCPDRTLAQSRSYITDSMGERFIQAVIADLPAMAEENINRVPLICLLSLGSDPTDDIEKLAKTKNLPCRAVSMGQGQEVHARRYLTQSFEDGGWLLLQNCHLGGDYMLELLDQINDKTINIAESFRIWITTDVMETFPINLLQCSIKYSFDPPAGVKAGLRRTFLQISQEALDISSTSQWKYMLYGIAFMHTIVQERRKFGPLGWNIPYEFNASDYNASVMFLQNHLDDMDPKKGPNWNCVRYMLGEVQYGGRVTDDYDQVLLNTYCHEWFGDSMFTNEFNFFKSSAICYNMPKNNEAKTPGAILDFIGQLPNSDSPEVFGLHSNADIQYSTNNVNRILSSIVNIQPKESSGGGGETREDVVKRMASEFLDKLPDDFLDFEVRARLKKMGQFAPINIFLKQEIGRMQRVIATVRTTLMDLRLAIAGTIIMSEDLQNALDQMYDARIPESWSKVSWDSATLGFWFTVLV
jgi:dynein heavy chain